MITGVHLIEIKRIKHSMENPKFLSRLFSPQELKFLMGRHFTPAAVAESYCAKCAFIKAMGAGFRNCKMNEISVLSDYIGSPYISVSGNTKMSFAAKKCHMTVSISHTRMIATASVTFFQNT